MRLMHHYWAANLHKIVYWFQAPETDWCVAEGTFCTSASLSALITARLPLSLSQLTSSPVVSSTLRIWTQFRYTHHLTEFSLLSPMYVTATFLQLLN